MGVSHPFKIDNRLEEQNFGIWHERPMVSSVWDDISQRMSKPMHPTSFVNYDDCPPEGTSFEDVYQKGRCLLLSDLIAKRPSKPHND